MSSISRRSTYSAMSKELAITTITIFSIIWAAIFRQRTAAGGSVPGASIANTAVTGRRGWRRFHVQIIPCREHRKTEYYYNYMTLNWCRHTHTLNKAIWEQARNPWRLKNDAMNTRLLKFNSPGIIILGEKGPLCSWPWHPSCPWHPACPWYPSASLSSFTSSSQSVQHAWLLQWTDWHRPPVGSPFSTKLCIDDAVSGGGVSWLYQKG